MTVAIRVEGLSKSFGVVRAVDDVSFEVAEGEVFALLGSNGAGKTTSIEILEGLVLRDGGYVELLGVDPGLRRHQRWLRSRIGVVPQELSVEPVFTVRQVLDRHAGFFPSPLPTADVIELVGLTGEASARVRTLSGGQQRRLDIGLGIIGDPQVLFLDEPTTGLDPVARRTTWSLIRELSNRGTTVLLTSHYMDEVEALADRVAVLAHGRIAASGTPGALGRRDHGLVTVRFAVPEGMACGELPVAATAKDGDELVITTDDEVRVLAQLTNWALERNVPISNLTVSRVSLEEAYLQLTSEESDPVEAAND